MTTTVILLSYGTHIKANILIDETGCARLADIGLTIILDPAHFLSSSSYAQGGTVRWTSAERIVPQEFGLKDGRPTKSSDCYSLGMVIYETISGNIPFHKNRDITVFVKVLKGEHPSRGTQFTESLWKMLEMCWAFQPNNRPSIEDVLQCLESVSISLDSPPSAANEEVEKGSDDVEGSAKGSPGVLKEPDGTMTENIITASSDSSYIVDAPVRAASVASGSSIVEDSNEVSLV